MNLVAALKQPIDLIDAPAARIHANDRALLSLLIQLERPLQISHQQAERFSQIEIAGIEPIEHDLFILRRQHPSQLTAQRMPTSP